MIVYGQACNLGHKGEIFPPSVVLHGINFNSPLLYLTTYTLPYINPPTNPIILHSLHMAEPKQSFINPLTYHSVYLIVSPHTLWALSNHSH